MKAVEVSRKEDLRPAAGTPGISREVAMEGDDAVVIHTIVKCGVESGWHHHGERNVYGYVLSGRGRFEFGPGGTRSVEVEAGGYFHIPVGLIHREINPSANEDHETVVVSIGTGPTVVNLEGPEEQ